MNHYKKKITKVHVNVHCTVEATLLLIVLCKIVSNPSQTWFLLQTVSFLCVCARHLLPVYVFMTDVLTTCVQCSNVVLL